MTAAILAGLVMGASCGVDVVLAARFKTGAGPILVLGWIVFTIIFTWWAAWMGAVPVDSAVALIVCRAIGGVVGVWLTATDLVRMDVSSGDGP